MIDLHKVRNFIPVIFLLVLIASCSYFPHTSPSPAHQTKRHLLISTHNPQKGINGFKIEYAKHPNDQDLIKEYIKSLEDLRKSADRASEKGDFASAGRLYHVLFKNYQDFRTFSKSLSFDRDYLHARLSYCKEVLSRKGFEEYRKGNLNEAIGCWHDYLAIDPYNEDIRKAVSTVTVQQKNLMQTK